MKRVLATLGVAVLGSLVLTSDKSSSEPLKPPAGLAQSVASSAPAVPYLIVSTPNPKLNTAIVGIVSNQAGLKKSEAKGLAVYAHRQVCKNRKFVTGLVFVFAQMKIAEDFAKYQNARHSAPLTSADYQKLASLWKGTLVCYVGTRETGSRSFDPQSDPANWWKPLLALQEPAPKTQNPAPK